VFVITGIVAKRLNGSSWFLAWELLCIRWGSGSASGGDLPCIESLHPYNRQKVYICQINNKKPTSIETSQLLLSISQLPQQLLNSYLHWAMYFLHLKQRINPALS